MVERIDPRRLQDLFLDLVRIDSHSRREGPIARRLEEELRNLGAAELWADDAGERVGGETGNLIALFPGTAVTAPPILLCAHMDTVAPGEGVRPVVEGDVIRSDGTTILGADDKSGIAVICEVIRSLGEKDVPHGPIDVVFTICEETGLLGAKHLDLRSLRARMGLVFDSDVPGTLFRRAPAANAMDVTVHGVEAHAGMAPERGINAIRVASEAVAAMRLGRVDDETTANLGLIRGGVAQNVVPNRVDIRAEARSHDTGKLRNQTDHMRTCFEEAASRHAVTLDGHERRASVDFRVTPDYEAMNLPEDSGIVQLVKSAGERVGAPIRVSSMMGGCDANVLNPGGIEVANLGTGMREIHTVNEWIRLSDMVRTAEVVLETLALATEGV